jgi:hypothetical protein
MLCCPHFNFKFKINKFIDKFLLGVSGSHFSHRNILFFIRMNRFRNVYTEHTDYFIFSIIFYDYSISVHNPDHLVLVGMSNRRTDSKKEGQKMNGFKGYIHWHCFIKVNFYQQILIIFYIALQNYLQLILALLFL